MVICSKACKSTVSVLYFASFVVSFLTQYFRMWKLETVRSLFYMAALLFFSVGARSCTSSLWESGSPGIYSDQTDIHIWNPVERGPWKSARRNTPEVGRPDETAPGWRRCCSIAGTTWRRRTESKTARNENEHADGSGDLSFYTITSYYYLHTHQSNVMVF